METSTQSLRSRQHSLIEQLANAIETIWAQHLDLSPYQLPPNWDMWKGD